jgi:excisionase family DNA binding protein
MLLSGKKMLTTAEAAQYLGLSKATLEAWRVHGHGPVFCKMSKAVRYSAENLEQFKTDCARTSTSEVSRP